MDLGMISSFPRNMLYICRAAYEEREEISHRGSLAKEGRITMKVLVVSDTHGRD